ncbi:MAG TPA: hypothetical protein VIV40_35915 [Kofleriaceae bacterium]
MSAIGGLYVGVGHTIDVAGDYFTTHEAEAATAYTPATTPTRLPSASLAVKVTTPEPANNIFGVSDTVLLAPIGAAPVTRVKLNHGGTSLSLRVDFANGARASFKPEQVWPQSDPRREIAAYRIDRLLGIGHVAPAKPIKLTVAEVIAAADPQLRTYTTQRLADEARAHNGELRGMAAWWIPEIKDMRLGGFEMHEPEAMQQLIGYLQIGAPVPAQYKKLVEQFAECIVFDVVIDNSDRWSGSNTKISPDGNTLFFMDNTLSFSKFLHGHDTNLRPLLRMQRFPRALVARLRTLTLAQITQALAVVDDRVGLGPLLTAEEMRAIIARKDHVLEHIDGLIKQFGEDAVLALP